MSSWSDEYPRPLLRRKSFLPIQSGWTLNGAPISLPFPPEAELSGFPGVPGERLEYRVSFPIPRDFRRPGERLVLHFGAVDQWCEVSLNGHPAARHEGGYLPFEVDITDFAADENLLLVTAFDNFDTDYPYGKQSPRPHGMWYTGISGIWQPVWLESVPERGAVRGIRVLPDLHGADLEIDTDAESVTVTVPELGLSLPAPGGKVRVEVPSPVLWTPEEPRLYGFTVATPAETVESYFALRTVTVEELCGHRRILLNSKPIFLHAVLDQGYYPGGIFLPEAPGGYEEDILRMKALGFNALRKHIKLEPEAFYSACDRLGMLVLQDMVNSGEYDFLRDTLLPTIGLRRRSDTRRPVSKRRRTLFEDTVSGAQRRLFSHPCVVGYTIFNEGWGQYESDRIVTQCALRDPSRFYIAASGWFAQSGGDGESRHIYFRTTQLRSSRPEKFLFLSECGGFSRRVEGHVREDRKNYGYGARKNSQKALTDKILSMYGKMVLPSIKNGLCGCVYTQLSDVEGETNGLYTFDREVLKVDPDKMLELSQALSQEHLRQTNSF